MRSTTIIIMLSIIFGVASAQSTIPFGQTIKRYPLEIAYNKTSSIIFPAAIKSVDRGSRDILAQKAKGVENVLQLKAGRENFQETNLTVITSDGTLHQFTVNFSRQPTKLTIDLSTEEDVYTQQIIPLIFENEMTESEMEYYSQQIASAEKTIRFVGKTKDKISFLLNGIYIKNDVIFYHFRISNQSNIDYDIDFLRFYIQDRVRVKRMAMQEVDVRPVYVFGNDDSIDGRSIQDVVFALEKFTIPDAKRLVVEMFEENGGRNFKLHIRNRSIVNARLLE